MKKLFQIVLVSSLSLLCFSCYYDEIQEDYIITVPDIPDDPDDPDYVEISFQNDVQIIFDAHNCMDCHNTNLVPDLRDGYSYNALVPAYVTPEDADASSLYTFLFVENHRDLNDEHLVIIKAWINQGAKNN
jgi:hypothetical protein